MTALVLADEFGLGAVTIGVDLGCRMYASKRIGRYVAWLALPVAAVVIAILSPHFLSLAQRASLQTAPAIVAGDLMYANLPIPIVTIAAAAPLVIDAFVLRDVALFPWLVLGAVVGLFCFAVGRIRAAVFPLADALLAGAVVATWHVTGLVAVALPLVAAIAFRRERVRFAGEVYALVTAAALVGVTA